MNNIETTITKIKEAQATILRDPPNDFRVLAGFEMARTVAKREIEGLNKTLADQLLAIAVPVFITGDNATSLANEICKITPAATVDLDNIYKTVFNAVSPSIGRDRTFGINQFMLVMSTLRQMALDNDLSAIEMPSFEEQEVVRTDNDLNKVILKYANKAVGVELAAVYARKQAAEQAVLSVDSSVSVFPVMLINANPNHQGPLAKTFKRPVDVSLVAPNEVTEEAVIEALKTIKKTIKKTKE